MSFGYGRWRNLKHAIRRQAAEIWLPHGEPRRCRRGDPAHMLDDTGGRFGCDPLQPFELVRRAHVPHLRAAARIPSAPAQGRDLPEYIARAAHPGDNRSTGFFALLRRYLHRGAAVEWIVGRRPGEGVQRGIGGRASTSIFSSARCCCNMPRTGASACGARHPNTPTRSYFVPGWSRPLYPVRK